MKYCGKCGTGMGDGVKFCPSCGEPQEVASDPVAVVKDTVMKNKKNLGKAAGIAVAAILILVILSNLFTPGYKKAVKKFFNAIEDKKVSKILDMYPDFMLDGYDKDDLEDLEDDLKEELSGIKISYKITDSEKMDDDDVEDLEDMFQLFYGEDIKIKKGYEVEVKLTAKQDGTTNTRTLSVYSLKIGSKWVVYSSFLGF